MTSPVLAALAQARMRAAPMFTSGASLIGFPHARPRRYREIRCRFAALRLSIERLWPAVQEISQAHAAAGLADPTLGGIAAAAVSDVAGIPPPRSWPEGCRQRFRSLPYDLQTYVASHEAQREKALRRAQNEAAIARQKLAACQQPKAAATEEIEADEHNGPEASAHFDLKIGSGKSVADIDAIIDPETVARENPGVPSGVIRNLLTAHAPACPCAQYLEIRAGSTR